MRPPAQRLGEVGRLRLPPDWMVDFTAPGGNVEQVSRALAAATAIVWQATCQRYPGRVPVAVRPILPSPCAQVANLGRALAYPLIKVTAIKEIDAQGAVVTWPAAAWRWEPDGLLVKQNIDDGRTVFPQQDWARPVTHPGSWWVELLIGAQPPGDVLAAVALLAKEIVLLWTDPEQCSLPDKVRSITRQGTTIEFDRSAWAGVPLMKELIEPWPKGHGCSKTDFEYGRDPTDRTRWVEVPQDLVPT